MSSLENEAKAALIVIAKIRPILVSHAKNPKVLTMELGPIFGFNWNKQLMVRVGSRPINDFIQCVRDSSLDNAKIQEVRRLFKGTFYADVGPIPVRWEIWRQVLTVYLLYELTPFQTWMEILSSLEESYLFTPLELSVLSYLEPLALDNHYDFKGKIVLLWQSTM